MEPQGVFVLSEPGLVVGPNNVLRHTICHRFAMVAYTQNNMPPTNMPVHTTCRLRAFTTVSYSP